MDVVSSGSGKLESLEFVRKSRGYGAEVTVACGDSGNDIAMMEVGGE